MWQYRKEVTPSRENDERADQAVERSSRAKLNGTNSSAQYCTQDGCRNRTRQAFIDLREKTRKWRGIVSCKHPEETSDHGDGGDVANQHVQQHDEQQAKRGGIASSGLSVDFGKWEGTIAVDDGIQVADTIQNRDGVAKRGQETKTNLSQNSFG